MADAVWADEAIKGGIATLVFAIAFVIARLRWKRGGDDEQGQDSGLD